MLRPRKTTTRHGFRRFVVEKDLDRVDSRDGLNQRGGKIIYE